MLPQKPFAQTVSTSIIINAPADRIWPLVNNLDSVAPTSNFLFRNGVAHPTSTKTTGEGVGAARLCRLSTGDMPERISVWEPGKRLVFDVLQTPACMKEWNPFGPVKAAHLTGYYSCRQGEFLLRSLGPDKTEVIGISRFDHRFGPTWYWSLWTTYIVHSVHSSVLDEIKRRTEAS